MKALLGIILLTACFSVCAQRVKENIYQKVAIPTEQPVEEAKPAPKAPSEPIKQVPTEPKKE